MRLPLREARPKNLHDRLPVGYPVHVSSNFETEICERRTIRFATNHVGHLTNFFRSHSNPVEIGF
ncbi:hypothetical protein HanIR_Chr12g0606831 [Helianthus annuus]|nr:hypothetical protein HanIR_Chr12g0606831 [Helianthus annuus]